jgi:cytochrome c oxidase subunit 4
MASHAQAPAPARHRTSGRALLLVWIALVVLTALSYIASRLHLGTADIVIALVIATIKTALVLLYFMHVIEEGFATRGAIGLAVLLFLTLLLITVADPLTRTTYPRAPAPPAPAPALQLEAD